MADQSVRFSENDQEIQPSHSLDITETEDNPSSRRDVTPEVQRELRDLSISVQKSRLQSRRMENFAFDPISLPPSRVASPSSSSRAPSGRGTPSLQSPTQSPVHSPLLTPAASNPSDEKLKRGHGSAPNIAKKYPDQAMITPELSSQSRERPSQSLMPTGHSSRPSSAGKIIAGAGIDKNSRSAPGSRTGSPSGRGSGLGGVGSGSTSSRVGGSSKADNDNQFIPSRKAPQPPTGDASKHAGSRKPNLQPRDAFQQQQQQHRDSSGGDSKSKVPRKSGIFSGLYHPHPDEHDKHHSSSMHDLKRFFKFGHKHKHSGTETSSRKRPSESGVQTPPRHDSITAVPFSDDHGLETKYGKFGKVLGSGAGGSVRLIKRATDGTTFAVKQFRPRHTYESEKDYNKKVTAEFCIGSTLHHGNIIETLDIIHEKHNWYEVMEYAPYDLFACVMTGKMSREEVTCCFMQIMSGVEYLHGMGLAHRDLKLDNVVVSDRGIMKLIDFGSAVMYKYPPDETLVKASGIVGSDPYLAPEVYDESKYDPRAVDLWSLGIIYCCMALRRFPWKLPRTSDVSYKYFVMEPTPGTPTVESLKRRASATDDGSSTQSSHHHHHHDSAVASTNGTTASDRPESSKESVSTSTSSAQQQQQQLRGPWRLLRLLPRESRYSIGKMLDTNPQTRATMEEVKEEPWLAQRDCCWQDESGKVHRILGHDHVLEPSGGSGADPSKK